MALRSIAATLGRALPAATQTCISSGRAFAAEAASSARASSEIRTVPFELQKKNTVWITGNVCQVPTLRATAAGVDIVEVSIAVHKKGKTPDVKETDFFRVFATGALARSIVEGVRKGQRVQVEGMLRQNKLYPAEGKPNNPPTSVKIQAFHVNLVQQEERSGFDSAAKAR
eukprot:CAMPEP_0202860256 /NCGR_PEP_ID=MMETSP1391-20130828/2038_1 /ASSEMBLY_ACC=CAM_ASM_000867 /TAXON_ID=1034604 /ORGANISM="Chlamydomonas leiostraca, Strain SAG 11-49" /LENGTH=170 /DNA_ID=CAMNT_0049539399 /DNA_START=25 /DNA_END=537 /DNA_ORIENTATION=+